MTDEMAKDILLELWRHEHTDKYDDETIRLAIERAITRIEDGRKQPGMEKWVPVSKKLPKRKGEYLVTMQGSEGGRWVEVEEFTHFGFHPWVIAWKPLSRVYKGRK